MSTRRPQTPPMQNPSWNETNRTLLAAVVVSTFVVLAIVAVSRVPRVQQKKTTTTPTQNVATATPLPPAPTIVKNRLGVMKKREGTTLTITAQTIVGQSLQAIDYTVRTGAATKFESVNYSQPATTSQTAPRAAITLEAIPEGAQVNAVAATNIRDQQEFAATSIEYQILTR